MLFSLENIAVYMIKPGLDILNQVNSMNKKRRPKPS
jgi:hypothetical protein